MNYTANSVQKTLVTTFQAFLTLFLDVDNTKVTQYKLRLKCILIKIEKLLTDKNAEISARKSNNLTSPCGGSVMGQNVKWVPRTKYIACQPRTIGEKVSK